MSDILFDVEFKGKFDNKIDRPKAILHFSKLFKLPLAKAEVFFDGTPRKLKKSLNLEKANNFRSILKKAGLRVSLKKQVTASEHDLQHKDQLTVSEPGVVIVNKPFVQPQNFNTSQFSLDEVGSKIVEPKTIEKTNIRFRQFNGG